MSELRVIKPGERNISTAQAPGMFRAEGVGLRTVGAESIWVGHVTVSRGVSSGAHHHGHVESGIYIISGNTRFRFGDRLQYTVEGAPGDFIFVPSYLIHQEINAREDEPS